MLHKKIYIFGYSGHSYVVLDSIIESKFKPSGYFDFQKATYNPYELDYMGFEKDSDLKKLIQTSYVFPTVGNNKIRKELVETFEKLDLKQTRIIDPSSNLSKKIEIGLSTYIGKNVVSNPLTVIEKGVIINTGSLIGHECNVREFAQIASGVVLAGNVTVGENSFIGSNSVVRQGIVIGKNSIVGAGAVVVKDVPENTTVVGNPAKPLIK